MFANCKVTFLAMPACKGSKAEARDQVYFVISSLESKLVKMLPFDSY